MKYKINCCLGITSSFNNNFYTKAVYDVFNNGIKLRYESNFISRIDIPYKRYRLE